MKPADRYRLKYRASQTIEPSTTAGVDSLPDELLARILAPVDLKSLVQARAVCKSWRASVEGKAVSDLRANTTEPLIALSAVRGVRRGRRLRVRTTKILRRRRCRRRGRRSHRRRER